MTYNLSSDQESINRIKHNHQSALKSANHKFNLTYPKANKTTKKQRKTVYLNPPFSLTVAIKTGKEFLSLIKNTLTQTTHATTFLTGIHLKYLIAAWKI